MERKRLKKAALAVGIGGIGAGLIVTELLYRYAVCRDQGPAVHFMPQRLNLHSPGFVEERIRLEKKMNQKKHLDYTIVNADGVELRGFYFPCGEKPCKRIAFIVHGYHATHLENSAFLHEYYHARGFDVFTCDHVASGLSGGKVIGWGLWESRDCLQWLELLQEEFGRDIQVILHGLSMGGATVLMMSDRAPACVKFIVDDCGFTSAEETAKLPKPLFEAIRVAILLRDHYDLAKAESRSHVRRAKLPILFVHGRADPTVPFWMGEELYNLCPTEKDCLFTDDAKHVETMYLHPKEFQAKIDAFVEKYIK